jgi:hypothetical protein
MAQVESYQRESPHLHLGGFGMYEDPDSLDCEAMILAAELYNYLVFFFPEHD